LHIGRALFVRDVVPELSPAPQFLLLFVWNHPALNVMSIGGQSLNAVPDEELVRQFQRSGDGECFAELFRRYRKRIYLACKGFFASGAAAEDATQETFLRAYRNMHRFFEGNFGAWLAHIARNVCIDQWRKQRFETFGDGTEAAEMPAAGSLDTDSELHFAVERLREEMEKLPPEQRACLQMKIEGYSYEETALRTGLTVEAVKSHLQNGRRMLWQRLEGMLSQLK
jgi:RNA polymerase sigma factor (sigma-70 family)